MDTTDEKPLADLTAVWLDIVNRSSGGRTSVIKIELEKAIEAIARRIAKREVAKGDTS